MGHMIWPPKIVRTDVLGQVRDVNGRNTPRDIGRSTYLGGNTYYAFGDTFCHNDKGEFIGGTNNTIALVPNPREPTRSQYLERQPHVSLFVPHTKSEEAWENEPDHKKNNDRITCWSFGGIIEDAPGSGKGWVFFDKIITHGGTGGKAFGIGVCRVSLGNDKHVKCERVMGDEMIFGEDEPRFASITSFVDDDGWVYGMGSKDVNPPWDMRNLLTRIRRDADFTRRENYEFWVKDGDNGKWQSGYEKFEDLKNLNNIDIQAQGAIIKCPELAPEGKPYMWWGVNKFMAGHLYIGCAPEITGPWDIQDGGEIPNDIEGNSGQKYALYPNQFASDLERGEMLCTWSDGGQFGGKVVAARFWFQTEGGQAPPPPQVIRPGGGGQQPMEHHGVMDKLKGIFN